MRFTAIMSSVVGHVILRAHRPTANLMSGRVHSATHIRDPTMDWYMGMSGASFCCLPFFGRGSSDTGMCLLSSLVGDVIAGVKHPLQFVMPNFSSICSIWASCDNVVVPFGMSRTVCMPSTLVMGPMSLTPNLDLRRERNLKKWQLLVL